MSIYIAAHKPYWFPKLSEFVPIELGASNRDSHFFEIRDDLGDNISARNSQWCEMTALYWIWKNDHHSKIISLCHYRRYFAFGYEHNKISEKYVNYSRTLNRDTCIPVNYTQLNRHFLKKIIDPQWIGLFNNFDIILPDPLYMKLSVKEQYILEHGTMSWNAAQNAIHKVYPEFDDAFIEAGANHKVHLLNMFYMPHTLFNDYASFIFPVLFEVENHIEIPNDSYQRRLIGFLAERLMDVWVTKRKLNVCNVPIVFIREDGSIKNKIFGDIMNIFS